MGLLIGTSEGMFVVDQASAPAPGAVLTGRSVHTVRRANGSILAGAADGVYRSDDAGRSWQPSGCEGEDVWAIAASAANQHVVFAGVHPAALFRSDDHGRSWSPVPSLRGVPGAENWRLPSDPNGSRALAIVLDETRPEHLWVGVEVGGILETSDGGTTWVFTLAGRNPDIHGLARDPAQPDVLYAATGYGRLDPNDPDEPAGVYRSDDGGESWRYAWPDADRRWTRPMCIDARAPHALTVASCPNFQSSQRNPGGAQSMLYQSTDSATTWRSLGDAAHAPSAVNITAIAVAPERPGSVVVGMENGEVWQVSPEAEWTPLASGLPTVQALLPLG
jgi:photosystem II stability/assembly factor-like uncharacterized protein